MSSTPYFSIAILSTPKPNARPEYFLLSILQFLRTIGLTTPHPSISSHLPFLDLISTSADGSVKGKYDGLKRTSTSFPNKEE